MRLISMCSLLSFLSLLSLSDSSEDNCLLSRRRRFLLPSNSGWDARIGFALSLPVRDLSNRLTFRLPFIYRFDTGLVTGRRSDFVPTFEDSDDMEEDMFVDEGRSMAEPEFGDLDLSSLDRSTVLSALSSIMHQIRVDDGHQCLLRSLCEMALMSELNEGLVGDVLELLNAPMHMLANVTNDDEFVRAQRQGKLLHDCSTYRKKCRDLSIFGIEDEGKQTSDTFDLSQMLFDSHELLSGLVGTVNKLHT